MRLLTKGEKMDRDVFIRRAPYYYALAIALHFIGNKHATKKAIQEAWTEEATQYDPGAEFLYNETLFDKAISILASAKLISEITDDFGPSMYAKLDTFDTGMDTLQNDQSLPFHKFTLIGSPRSWLNDALVSANAQYAELGITPADFEFPDLEWEPLPINRKDPTLRDLTDKLDETIEAVRSDNGYNANLPQERDFVLESLTNVSQKLKKADYTSRGYLRKNLIEPAKALMRRFRDTSIGLVVSGLRAAIEAWVKNNALDLLNELQKWFH